MSDDDIQVPPQYPQSPEPQYPRPPYYGGQASEAPQPPHTPQSSHPHGRSWSGASVVAAAVAGSIIGGVLMAAAMLLLFGPSLSNGGALRQPQSSQQTPVSSEASVAPGTPLTTSSDADQPIEAVADRVTPSVVNIAIEQSVTDPFTGMTRTQVVGNGSGVIIRSDGYILTNNHVVSGASKILVTLGLQNLPAKVVGADPTSDIAVIKIDKTGLPAAKFGDSEKLRVGEQVIAIGSPFGLDKTVTAGIVSALHRTGSAADQSRQTVYGNLIQTDAPINPGNSGGALADLAGEVIGINTLIQTGGAQQSAGIGFAIPIKLAAQVADQLIKTGKATHTFLGVAAVDVTESNAQQLGVKATSGALVQEVQAGSPAEKAGIKRGDVVVRIGDTPVQNSQDMVGAVRSHNPGEKVPVEVIRGTQHVTVDVTLGSAS